MAIKKKEYRVVKKRSGRFTILARGGKPVNGEDKVKILAKEGLVKKLTPKKKEEAPAEAAE